MQPLDPVSYLSQGKFHRSVVCKRTQSRVTFALIGDWDEEDHSYYTFPSSARGDAVRPIIVYVLPSGCSRYMGVLLDGIASAHGLRMVAIDRPGAGGTPSCPGVQRTKTSTQQTITVLDWLGYGQSCGKINILTHSAGWFYALDLLTERADLFDSNTRVVFSSPFVPTLFSGNIVLSLLPKGLVQILPAASTLVQACGSTIAWSAGVGQDLGLISTEKIKKDESTERKKIKDKRTREKSQARLPTARFHPPYELHLPLGLEAWKTSAQCAPPIHPTTGRRIKDGQTLLFEYFIAEGGVKAAMEDFLFCLGKVEGMDNIALEKWTEEKMKQLAGMHSSAEGESNILIVWCEKDFMIPAKGRKYMDTLFQRTGLKMNKWIMADGGHDAGIVSREVMDDVLEYLSAKGEIK